MSPSRKPRSLPRLALVAAGGEILGGHSVQAEALLHELDQEGYEAIFLPINPRFPSPLAPLRRLPCARTIVNEALYLPSLSRIRSVDAVHVFSASYWSFLLAPAPAMLAARAMGKRVVLHYHSGEAADHLERWSVLVHPWLRLAHEIVVPSVYLQTVFERHGYRTRVIPNIVDTSRFRFRQRRPLRPRLLSTRNLERHYGVDDTIRAFARVRASHPDATLTIAGYGSEESRLRGLAASLGVSGARFVGRVEPESMPALYDEADIFLNASLVDNQPVSILEAFASGLPVVSTPTGDLAQLVRERETGRSVPPNEPEEMARAVCELLREPESAARLADRARMELAKHAWPQVRGAWGEVYAGETRASTARPEPSVPNVRGASTLEREAQES